MIDHVRLTSLLRRFAGTLVGEYDLEEVLSRLGEEVASLLGAVGAGAMLADDDGKLHFVATSDEVLGQLEQLQIELDEGPCLQAYRTCDPVVAADLSEDARFPRFGPRAVQVGMRAVHSFPMHISGAAVGALNVYTDEPSDLSEEAIGLGRTFADIATIYVIHDRDLSEREQMTADLQKALDSRVVIEQAKGFLAAKCEVDPGPAFELIRQHARSNHLRAREVARAVLDGDLSPGDLTGD